MHILVQQNSSLPSRKVQKKLWEAVQLPGRHRCLAAIHAALASGAAANAADASGMTALHWAASGNPDAEAVTAAIAVLLAEKADIHFKTKNNQATPLHCATTNASPDAAIAAVLALTAAGADVRAKTGHNGEPLHWVVLQTNAEAAVAVAQILITAGGDPGACLTGPCGHLVCEGCAQTTQVRQHCPVCRSARSGLIKVFLELVLHSVNVAVLGALFSIGAAPRPSNLGVQDYGGGLRTLSLCPPTPNCISTAEEANDPAHYVPQWTYNPEEGRGRKNPATPEQAMAELLAVVSTTKPEGFTPKIIKQTSDYVYVEYESPTLGFIDDVEFFFPSDKPGIVEYRSASRVGSRDGNANRKRIKALRLELQKKGWKSVGY
ncbi:hypothetical protein COHA_007084 [Chlorella ohadii]|uniref:RING-type domain-containing protein n=1 Tax=Chlorella ohadii TaxID=2649997 RepID=A0AAD5H3T8_9CHLO|nr:hypothetical protein COHA_007084 [Chlorella ohadii]